MKPYLLTTLAAASCLLGAALPSQAAVLTSFEVEEGFTPNTRTNTAGWAFSNNTRIRVSNGTTEPAFEGSYSIYTYGGVKVDDTTPSAVTATNTNWAPKEDKLDQYSFSFISPGSAWASQAVTAWIYIGLWDTELEGIRYVNLWARHGNTAVANQRISYTLDNGSGIATSTFAQAAMDFEVWNTISADFDFAAGRYSISLNDSPVLNNILLPTSWSVNAIIGTWLVSPGVGYTTYYDSVTAVPEPGSIALLAFAGGLAMLRVRRKG